MSDPDDREDEPKDDTLKPVEMKSFSPEDPDRIELSNSAQERRKKRTGD